MKYIVLFLTMVLFVGCSGDEVQQVRGTVDASAFIYPSSKDKINDISPDDEGFTVKELDFEASQQAAREKYGAPMELSSEWKQGSAKKLAKITIGNE